MERMDVDENVDFFADTDFVDLTEEHFFDKWAFEILLYIKQNETQLGDLKILWKEIKDAFYTIGQENAFQKKEDVEFVKKLLATKVGSSDEYWKKLYNTWDYEFCKHQNVNCEIERMDYLDQDSLRIPLLDMVLALQRIIETADVKIEKLDNEKIYDMEIEELKTIILTNRPNKKFDTKGTEDDLRKTIFALKDFVFSEEKDEIVKMNKNDIENLTIDNLKKLIMNNRPSNTYQWSTRSNEHEQLLQIALKLKKVLQQKDNDVFEDISSEESEDISSEESEDVSDVFDGTFFIGDFLLKLRKASILLGKKKEFDVMINVINKTRPLRKIYNEIIDTQKAKKAKKSKNAKRKREHIEEI